MPTTSTGGGHASRGEGPHSQKPLRREQGVPPRAARAQARFDLAITRGLLLDLLATGDRTGVDEAMEQAGALYEAWSRNLPPDSNPKH